MGRARESPNSYHSAFVSNPFPTEEWSYTLDGRLVGVGLVDALAVGLSAIYFVHDPVHHRRGLGTWNVLCLIRRGSTPRAAPPVSRLLGRRLPIAGLQSIVPPIRNPWTGRCVAALLPTGMTAQDLNRHHDRGWSSLMSARNSSHDVAGLLCGTG